MNHLEERKKLFEAEYEVERVASDLLNLRREYLIKKDFKKSDKMRKVLTDEGMKVQDIFSENWVDWNLDTNDLIHFKCKDLHHCIKEFDHIKRLNEIKDRINEYTHST